MSSPRSPQPFVQLPFSALPERPHRAHEFLELPLQRVTVQSEGFGRVGIAYREAGDATAPPLLLVHGLMTTSYSWRYVMHALAERWRVIAIDLVGCGDSDKPDVRYHPDHVARSIVEVMDTLAIRGSDVVGNSMGGYLAMWSALIDREAIGRLVNIHSPGVPMARLTALRLAMGVSGSEALLSAMVSAAPERWVHKNVHYYDETLKSLEEAREYARPLRDPAGRRTFARYLRDTLDVEDMRRFTQLLADDPFPIPLTLLYAPRDPMVPPEVGKRLAELVPAARLRWLEGCSHFAHIDRPELVVDEIQRALVPPDVVA
jgi:pimeloyl-ACP methyl ester carboxylesterase